MAEGVELATAWVRLVPSVEGIQGGITEAIMPSKRELDESASQAGSGWSSKFATAVGALALGAAVAAAFNTGFDNALALDSVTTSLEAQLGLSESESARAGDAAGSLYADAYGGSLDEVGDAVANVISSIDGMRTASADALEEMTGDVLSFSDAFGIDTARTTQLVGQLITTGLAADADEALDLLTATFQQVPANVREDVMDAADEYGPFFSALGIEGSAAFGMLADGADAGMYGIDKFGDAVKEFTIRATDLGDTGAQDALAALGLDGQQMANDLLAGGETAEQAFATIVGGLQGITDPAAQAEAAVALFGTPLEDLGKDQIPGFLDALTGVGGGLGEVEGAAAALDETVSGSVATSLESMRRQWESVLGDAVEPLLPALQELMGFISENPVILQAAAIALGAFAIALGVAAIAQWAMNSALLASPITWIILAVVALIAAIVLLALNWDTVVAWISEVWGGFVAWLTEVISGFGAWWTEVWAGIGAFFTGLWDGLVAWVTEVWGGFISWLQDIGNGLAEWWNGLWEGIGDFFAGVWDGIVDAARGAINTVIDLVNGIINAINDVSGVIGGAFGVDFTIPNVPRLAQGATIKPRPGGTLAVLAEAGRPETVVDTGLVNRALAEGLNGDRGGSDSDQDRLADRIAELLWRRERTTARTVGAAARGYTDETLEDEAVVRR